MADGTSRTHSLSWELKRHIVINEELLRELAEHARIALTQLETDCAAEARVSQWFTVTYSDNSKMETRDLNEVIQDDNPDASEMVSIHMLANLWRDDPYMPLAGAISFRSESSRHRYLRPMTTADVSVQGPNKVWVESTLWCIERMLSGQAHPDQHNWPHVWASVAALVPWGFLLLGLVSLMRAGIGVQPADTDTVAAVFTVLAIATGYLSTCTWFAVRRWLLRSVWPPVVFAIGDGKDRYEKLIERRSWPRQALAAALMAAMVAAVGWLVNIALSHWFGG